MVYFYKKIGKKYILRLSDNYTAFYFRSIIKAKGRGLVAIESPKNLASLLGLQFENLTHNNIGFILNRLSIESKEVIFAGSYLQTSTTKRQGCQIDLLIQTKNRVYVCECKLHNCEIKKSCIAEVETKIALLIKPRGTSFHPVLIHANQVSERVIEEDYFSAIIDLGEGIFA